MLQLSSKATGGPSSAAPVRWVECCVEAERYEARLELLLATVDAVRFDIDLSPAKSRAAGTAMVAWADFE